jgi:hypothetical protein
MIKYRRPRPFLFVPVTILQTGVNHRNLIKNPPTDVFPDPESQFDEIDELITVEPESSVSSLNSKNDSSGYSTNSARLTSGSKLGGASNFPVVKKVSSQPSPQPHKEISPNKKSIVNFKVVVPAKTYVEHKRRLEAEQKEAKRVNVAVTGLSLQTANPASKMLKTSMDPDPSRVEARLTKTGKIVKNPPPNPKWGTTQFSRVYYPTLLNPSPSIPSNTETSSVHSSSKNSKLLSNSALSDYDSIYGTHKERDRKNLQNEIYKGDPGFSDDDEEEETPSNDFSSQKSIKQEEAVEITDVAVDSNMDQEITKIKVEYSDNDSTDIEDEIFYNNDSSAESESDNDREERDISRMLAELIDDDNFINDVEIMENSSEGK